MAAPDLTALASQAEQQANADGMHQSRIPALGFYRASAPSDHDAAVYEPSLCIIAQGAKEVLVGGEVYRYDPAHWLVVSVDLPATSRVVEASLDHPCLAVRISLDSAVVGDLLAEGASVPPIETPVRAIAVTPADPLLLDAITRLVSLLESPQDIGPLAPLVLREITYRVLTGPQGS